MIFYRRIEPIHAITFDLDDTLYNNHPLMVVAERQLMEFMHSRYPASRNITRQSWKEIKQSLLRNTPDLASDMGQLRLRTIKQGLSDSGYCEPELSHGAQVCFERFYHYRSDFTVAPEILDTLQKLSGKVPLVAITNGNVNLQQIGIAPYFSACFKANLRCPMKPHPHMFNLAQQHLDIPARHILHVGDNLEKDVKGAIDAGFQSAWHACNRAMWLGGENVQVLPHLSVNRLSQLCALTESISSKPAH